MKALLQEIMNADKQSFGEILDNPGRYEVQALFTKIIRDTEGITAFESHGYGVNAKQYFYPASTVKMAVAALALHKINSLSIPNVNRHCTLNIEKVKEWQTAESGVTVETYIYKMLSYSDNNAYNRLYEFLGQEYINETLQELGYTDCQIIQRFEAQSNADMNRTTNPVKLLKDGMILYSQPAITNKKIYSLKDKNISGLLRGKSHITAFGEKVDSPKEFYNCNYLSIEVMQDILKAIIFSKYINEKSRFNISEDDRLFLMHCMRGDGVKKKYFIYGGKGEKINNLEIYNKTGTAYGNILDNAYIFDKENNIEFMLTAVIFVNTTGVLGDDTSATYSQIGMPFLKNLGNAVYNYILAEKIGIDYILKRTFSEVIDKLDCNNSKKNCYEKWIRSHR